MMSWESPGPQSSRWRLLLTGISLVSQSRLGARSPHLSTCSGLPSVQTWVGTCVQDRLTPSPASCCTHTGLLVSWQRCTSCW